MKWREKKSMRTYLAASSQRWWWWALAQLVIIAYGMTKWWRDWWWLIRRNLVRRGIARSCWLRGGGYGKGGQTSCFPVGWLFLALFSFFFCPILLFFLLLFASFLGQKRSDIYIARHNSIYGRFSEFNLWYKIMFFCNYIKQNRKKNIF